MESVSSEKSWSKQALWTITQFDLASFSQLASISLRIYIQGPLAIFIPIFFSIKHGFKFPKSPQQRPFLKEWVEEVFFRLHPLDFWDVGDEFKCVEKCAEKNYLFLCSTPGESQWRLKNRQGKHEKINLAEHVLSEGPWGGSVVGWDRRRNHMAAMEILGKRRLEMELCIPVVILCSPARSSVLPPHLAAAMHANIIPGALPPRFPICATPGE